MKLFLSLRYRGLVLASMVFGALTFGATSELFFSTPLQAQATTTTTTTSSTTTSSSTETDLETGKPIITTPSGLKYVDIVPGTGAAVKTGDHVVVTYVGKLIDGTKFDASADHGGTFDYVQGVTGLIRGWTEGTSTMKVGGKRKLIIPPYLGYGMEGAGDTIPPNSTLVFVIELVAIKPN
jgi:peptidylprolyl isomerase